MQRVMWRAGLCAAAVVLCGNAALFDSDAIAQSKQQSKQQATQQPDLGPNVKIFTPQTPVAEMQAAIDKIYADEQHSEFGPDRYAILFTPGDYKVDVPIGFYTEIAGLGASPDDVRLTGKVHSDAAFKNDNATTTFWRAMEGLSVTPVDGPAPATMQWAVSQAAPFRRMHVRGNMVLNQRHGWSSGGWMADTVVDGEVNSGTQQQWISRNVEWGSWRGSNWNMVFVGVAHPPAGEWPQPPYTKIDRTPVVRERPFLFVDGKGQYAVRVPRLRRNSFGVSWHDGSTPGTSVPLSQFFLAKPTDTAQAINTALAEGKNLLLTPGVYELDDTIRINRPGTIVLGLGFATLKPMRGDAAMEVADVADVSIAGLLFDAGEKESASLLEVGPAGSRMRHAGHPTLVADVFFRIGGAGAGKVKQAFVVNSNDVIVDHTWVWRADHGKGVGWASNTAANGFVVDGNNVTAYGLFVEHFQEFQTLWRGNGGRTFFYQSEIPYDPPTQAAWRSSGESDGWASYKVGDKVTSHQAYGLGAYSVFLHPDVRLTRAFEVPKTPDVRFEHMITVALQKLGSIDNVINDKGGATQVEPHRVTPKLTSYP